MKSTLAALLAAAVLTTLAGTAHAQVLSITDGALALDGSNILNNGIVIEAVNFDFGEYSQVTVNGVTFDPIYSTTSNTGPYPGANPSGPHFTFNANGTDTTDGGIAPTDAVYPISIDGVYQGTAFTLTNLTLGSHYQLQLLLNANSHDNRTGQYGDGGMFSDVITGGIPGPQFVIDNFIATGTTETISASGNLQVSGFVLEQVPEPSTYALMLGGFALLGICVRRKLALSHS